MKHTVSFPKLQLASSTHRLLALICSAILLLLLYAPLNAEEGFVVNVPHYLSDHGFAGVYPQSIYTCSDDAVVIVSRVVFSPDDVFNYYCGSITKLSPNGNLLWIKYFPDPSDYGDIDWIVGLGIDENDTVSLITGTFDNDQKYLVHVDSDGDIDSIPLDLGEGSIGLNKGLRTASGDFIALGDMVSTGLYPLNLAYYRISSDAQVLASSFIPPDTEFTRTKLYDAEIEADGNVLISCKINPDQDELLRLTMDGVLVERIELQDADSPAILHRSPGSEHTVVAHSVYSTASKNQILQIAWVAEDDITYQTMLDSSFRDTRSMISIGDDVYTISNAISESDYCLARFNYTDSYELAWSWNHPELRFYTGNENYIHTHHLLSSTQSGCIYVAGSYRYGPHLAVAKVLPTGQVPVEDDIAVPPLQKISAYPNPMKEHLNLKIDGASPEEASACLEVYNIKGQLVRNLESSRAGEYVWDGYDSKGRSCPTGIYFIRDSKGIYKQTKVIKMK